MKKFIIALIVSLFVITLSGPIFAAPLKVVLYMNGNLGDRAFFDSANRGFVRAQKELGITGKAIEGGYDPAKWEPDLEQLASGDWDVIIAGTWQLQEIVQKLAPQHPEKKWITYDTSVDYSKPGVENVYSILYSQNEGSYLAGALAAMLTTSKKVMGTNTDRKIGFIGGMDIPVINDFKVGYIQGAKDVDPKVEVLVSYAGNFNDPAKGKELALAMYDQGADIIFNGAAQTGLGILDAGKTKKQYTIGVDSDQYMLYKNSDPDMAAQIVTSMVKNIDESLFRALKLTIAGTLAYGKAETLGIKDKGVGLAINENYKKIVPPEFQAKITALADKIIKGQIKVDTAFGK
jgi:basic membrane protein A